MIAGDRVGRWFRVLNDRGHSDLAHIFLERLDGRSREDYSFLHREMDGAARLAQALRGFDVDAPALKRISKPSGFKKLSLLLRGLAGNSSSVAPKWKEFNNDLAHKTNALSWLLIDRRAEAALQKHARNLKVSVNAILLEHVFLAVRQHLAAKGEEFSGAWMMPVSLRGAFSERVPTGNKVGYLPVRMTARTDCRDIHAQVRRAFTENKHWSNWLVYWTLGFLPLSWMRKISKFYAGKVFWLGTFSDLGDWTPTEKAVPHTLLNSVWVASPLGNPNNPVSCAVATWDGRKTLSLRLHPSVHAEDPVGKAEEILASVVITLTATLAGLLAEAFGEAADFSIRRSLIIGDSETRVEPSPSEIQAH